MDIRFERKWQDVWIGMYWRKFVQPFTLERQTDIWICLIPCFPLHLTIYRKIGKP